MSKPESIIKYIRHPQSALLPLAGKGYLNWLDDRAFLKLIFKANVGYTLNLNNPRTFNEKLQWLKIYDHNIKYQTYVDKYAVKSYIADQIGEKYVIPTIGVWDEVNRIDFDKLPSQFVLKCVHGSSCNIICNDKGSLDVQKTREKLEYWMHKNWYWLGREWPYKAIQPRIIAEQFLEDGTGQLMDYKFFCFNGVVKCFKIDFDRSTEHRANYYTPDGALLEFGEMICPPDYERKIAMPVSLSNMISIAERLSKGIPFVRVDLYEVKGQIFFGELTLYPAAGLGPFTEKKWDYTLGEWLQLPEERGTV